MLIKQEEVYSYVYSFYVLCFIGFKGNARVILPGLTACIDCTLDLYPPQVSTQLV